MNPNGMSAQGKWDSELHYGRLSILLELQVKDDDYGIAVMEIVKESFCELPDGLRDLLQRSCDGFGFSLDTYRRNSRGVAHILAEVGYSLPRVAFE